MICIAGKNDIAIYGATLALQQGNQKVCACTNNSDDGIDRWQKSFKKFINDNGIAEVHLEEIYDDVELLFISLEYDRIINPSKFQSSKLYNIHFSLLPKYRGMYTSAWPILNNEKITGVTLHKIDQGIDTGNIVSQIQFPIDFSDTGRDVYLKYISYGKKLLSEQFLSLLNSIPEGIQQDKYFASYYSKYSIDYSNLHIDLTQTAINIHNQIRAYSFKEYQRPMVFGSYITEAAITNIRSTRKPGTILKENDKEYVISSIDYDVILKKYIER